MNSRTILESLKRFALIWVRLPYTIATSRVTIGGMLIVFYVATLSGISSGMAADSVSNATIERGEDYNITFEDRQRKHPIAEETGLDREVIDVPTITPERYRLAFRSAFRSALTALIVGLMEWASLVAVWTYKYGWWIKSWWLKPLSTIFGYVLLGSVGYYMTIGQWRNIHDQ